MVKPNDLCGKPINFVSGWVGEKAEGNTPTPAVTNQGKAVSGRQAAVPISSQQPSADSQSATNRGQTTVGRPTTGGSGQMAPTSKVSQSGSSQGHPPQRGKENSADSTTGAGTGLRSWSGIAGNTWNRIVEKRLNFVWAICQCFFLGCRSRPKQRHCRSEFAFFWRRISDTGGGCGRRKEWRRCDEESGRQQRGLVWARSKLKTTK